MIRPRIQLFIATSLVVVAVAAVIGIPRPSASQTVPNFSLITTPDLPYAGDRVTVTALPANFSASSTVFTWFRDDIELVALSGRNRSSISIATDPTRQETIRIRVNANPGVGFTPDSGSILIHTFPNPDQQEGIAGNLGTDFTLDASSVSPENGEPVEIRVTTFAFDKQAASFQWYVAGVLDRAQSGRGQSRFVLSAPPEGASRTVRVDVTIPGSGTRSKSITIQTTSIPFYWWTDTAVPYWYKGKALPSFGSRVTALALPTGQNTAELSYQWRINGAAVPRLSGIGRQSFTFGFQFPVKEQIGVRIQNIAGTFDKSVAIGIAPVRPRVAIYEVRPLRGTMYERELLEFGARAGEPYDFLAIPFFFPRQAALAYTWLLNGTAITGEFDQPWRFTLTSNAGTAYRNQLDVEVKTAAQGGERAAATLQANLNP